MRVSIEPSSIILTLSRRNLQSLLKMLDEGRVQGALTGRDEHVEILVQAQEDDVHYADRPAGSMSWERGEAPPKIIIECGTEDLKPPGAAWGEGFHVDYESPEDAWLRENE